MLKDRNNTIVIEEPYAYEMIDKLKRYRKGEFTEEEKRLIERSEKIKKSYKTEWI